MAKTSACIALYCHIQLMFRQLMTMTASYAMDKIVQNCKCSCYRLCTSGL